MNPSNLFMIVVVFAAFWFLVIRPQQQRQRQQAEMVSALAPGAEVLTIGGIYATVVEVGERIRLAVADGSEMEVSPHAIGRIVSPAGGADEDAPQDAAENHSDVEPRPQAGTDDDVTAVDRPLA